MTEAPADGGLDEVLRTLAERVRRLREERGLSVVALSFEAGLSESRVRALEAGRTTASLATLVALAETFGVEVAELFGDADRVPAGAEASRSAESPYVVPSDVVWGGELPSAPWMAPAAPSASTSPHVVPSAVVWGGDLPPASWTSATAEPGLREQPATRRDVTDRGASGATNAAAVTAPAPIATPAPGRGMDAVPPTHRATEVTWGGALPPASWAVPSSGHRGPASPVEVRPPAPLDAHPTSSADPVHTSPYVFVGSGPAAPRQPRTFAELRDGALAGREFSSLREFAVAAVVEGGFTAVAVARVFRLPVWRLEQWVLEAGHVRR